jgi:hypothetical protein
LVLAIIRSRSTIKQRRDGLSTAITMRLASLAMVRSSIGGLLMGRIENHDGRAWRARAEVCRAIADTFENPETRAKMYLVAAEYERMAEHADRREKEAAGEGGGRTGDIAVRTLGNSR